MRRRNGMASTSFHVGSLYGSKIDTRKVGGEVVFAPAGAAGALFRVLGFEFWVATHFTSFGAIGFMPANRSAVKLGSHGPWSLTMARFGKTRHPWMGHL